MKINITLDTETNHALVCKEENGVKKDFNVSVDNLFESLMLSRNKDAKEVFEPIVGMLHQQDSVYELIQTIQTGKNAYTYILKVEKQRVPFYIYSHFYGLCGMPRMLFAIKVVNGICNRIYTTAIKDDKGIISRDTTLYNYPFSNTASGIGSVCTGQNNIKINIDSVKDMIKMINYFYEMPNTLESYKALNNSEGLEFRDLASKLSNNDFDDTLLVNNPIISTYDMWIKSLTKSMY